MAFPKKGMPASKVLGKLVEKTSSDLKFDRILGSMCTRPHPLAEKVFFSYIDRNIGDPGLFPGTAKMEKEVVGMLGSLLHLKNASGNVVSGGTEANITALWAARNSSGKKEVIVPRWAHFSFDKAADLLGMKLVEIRDWCELGENITANTAAIVAVAGTTELGLVDPIEQIAKIAGMHGIHLHVDAAFGGFILPFIGYKKKWDFALPAVSSMAIDPHKMGLVPIPAGAVLFRDRPESVKREVGYLAGGKTTHYTITGTRPGAPAIAAWAMFNHLGLDGYRAAVSRCMRLTKTLCNGIGKIDGLSLAAEPVMNIVGIKSGDFGVERLAEKLGKKGWAVALFPNHLRVVVMPHFTESMIHKFLKDLKATISDETGFAARPRPRHS